MTKKRPKTIPTYLGLLILIIGVFVGIFLIKNTQGFSLKATANTNPSQVKITNISDTSFTVSWITQGATTGFISFGETTKLDQMAYDDRETSPNAKGSFFTHYVTLKNLKPATRYFFKIISGGKTFDNNGKPYEVTTGPTINLPLPAADTAYGIILESNGNPANGVIVYLSLANTTPLSSLTKEDGTWMVPLSMARNLSLTSYASYDRELQVEEVFVQGGNLGTATAITTTKNDNPVPPLTLGQTYDFRQPLPETSLSDQKTNFQQQPTPTSIISSQRSSFSLEPLETPTPSSSEQKFDILNPTEGEKISTQKPEFMGIAPPGEILEIKVESEVVSGQTLVNQNGSWSWTPPVNLSPGEHKVTVTLKDESGVTQKVVRTFTVLAAGESQLPSFVSTPSATLTSSPVSSPTAEPTRIIGTPTPTPLPPSSGRLTNTLILATIGLVLIFLGFYQFINL